MIEKLEYGKSYAIYLNSLYGKILYVLQINNKDLEFAEYKKTIRKLINSL